MRVPEVQVGRVRSVPEVAQAVLGQVAGLLRLVVPVGVSEQLEAQVRHQRAVVDRGRVRPPGPDQFLGCLRVAEFPGGSRHQIGQAAEQEVQVGLVARPQSPVQHAEDPGPDPPHLQENRQRLGGHQLCGQPHYVGAELLHCHRADVTPFGALGVFAAFVCRHQDLLLDAESA